MNKTTEGLQEGYNIRNFDAGPKTYSDTAFIDKIFTASGIGTRTGLHIADIMSGPGKLGQTIQTIAPDNKYYFFDYAKSQLKKIPDTVNRALADARKLPIRPASLDVALARYSIKDLTREDQPGTIKGIYDSLKSGGVLVVADMVATDETKDWLNTQHSLKQEYNGRDVNKEGKCHIPTLDEWIKMLNEAGFKVESEDEYTSHVDTKDWLNGNQISAAQLKEMNKFMLEAPENIRETFNIREEDGKVLLDYPVTILKAVKI